MLHEANSYAPTSAEPGLLEQPELLDEGLRCSIPSPASSPLPRSSSPAHLLFFPVIALVLAACSGSSPRFRSVENDVEEFRYAEKIRIEESREDDKKVDLSSFRANLSTSYRNETPPGVDRDAVLLDVVSYLGVPYQWGGGNKRGIDCSGFTSSVYRNSLKTSLPRTASGQYRVGSTVSKSNLQFGDLVFFNTTGGGPSHVGIYIEDDLFAHASVTYGVTISSLESTYYRKRFLGGKRVVR